MTDSRMESALTVLNECFWGDYNLTAGDILDRLDENDPGFDSFLFSKIIENSSYPSRHIRNLFPQAMHKTLLDKYLKQTGERKRLRLISANLTGDYSRVPEYRWQR
ncbi:MAG: hypothetical protein ACMUHX_10165 [bacterium]